MNPHFLHQSLNSIYQCRILFSPIINQPQFSVTVDVVDNFKVLFSMGLLKILNFCLYVLAKIIPLCQDPRLSIFNGLVLIMDLPNKTGSVMDYKKQTRWPDCQLLFEMDPAYQNQVSLKTVCLRECRFKDQKPTAILR